MKKALSHRALKRKSRPKPKTTMQLLERIATRSGRMITSEVGERPSGVEQSEVSPPAANEATKGLAVEDSEENVKASDTVNPATPSAATSTGSDAQIEEVGDAKAEEPQTKELEDTSPTVLNVPKLPSVVRAEPKIFEPLIGRDKVKRIVVLDTRIDDAISEPLDGGGGGPYPSDFRICLVASSTLLPAQFNGVGDAIGTGTARLCG